MERDYVCAQFRHPHLFKLATMHEIVSHVETVAKHFQDDGLSREDYLATVAAQPQLLLQKGTDVIGRVEAVLNHFGAGRLTRCSYLIALTDHPVLFRAGSAAMIASIERINAVQGKRAQPTDSIAADEPAQTEPEPHGSHYPDLATSDQQAKWESNPEETPDTRVDRPLLLQLERAMGRSGRGA